MSITSALPPLDPNRRYPLNEANQYLGQSRAKTYQDIAKENLRVMKDSSRTHIPGTEIIRRSTLAGRWVRKVPRPKVQLDVWRRRRHETDISSPVPWRITGFASAQTKLPIATCRRSRRMD